jgi:large subunit ribosomal protein L20
MTRIKRGFIAQKRRKKILKLAKSFKGSQSKLYKTANQKIMKANNYAYNDRRKKKNNFKRIWIRRINATARFFKTNYSKAINKLKISSILLNKKILANICISDKKTFEKIIEFDINKKVKI